MSGWKKYFLIVSGIIWLGLLIASIIIVNLPEEINDNQLNGRFQVVFDQSKEQVYSPFETTFTGMSEVSTEIMRQGGRVILNNEPLSRVLASKGSRCVLILGVAMFKKYTPEDISAIESFMTRGGGVFVMVEHDNLMNNGDFQNALTRRFGIEALPMSAHAKTENPHERFWTWCNVLNDKRKRVQLYLPAPLKISSQDVEIVAEIATPREPSQATVAVKNYKKGRFFVLADAEIAWNGDLFMGINVKDNMRFYIEKLTDLAGVEYLEKPAIAPSVINTVSDDSDKVLILRDGFSLTPLNSSQLSKNITAYFKKKSIVVDVAFSHEVNHAAYAYVIWINPLEKTPHIEGLSSIRKLILVSDGQSDIFGVTPKAKEMMQSIVGDVIRQYPSPINELAQLNGFSFNEVTVVTNGAGTENHFKVSTQGQPKQNLVTYRASSISMDKTMPLEWKTYLTAEKGAWDSGCITPQQNLKEPVMPFQRPDNLESLKTPVIIAGTSKVLAISDVELILDNSPGDTNDISPIIDHWLNDF